MRPAVIFVSGTPRAVRSYPNFQWLTHRRACALPLFLLAERREPSGPTLIFNGNTALVAGRWRFGSGSVAGHFQAGDGDQEQQQEEDACRTERLAE